MPGAFAHMIAADKAKSIMENDGIAFSDNILNTYPEWMQSGAVGPDYPYLHHAITSHDASDSWADLLHYKRTGDVVRSGTKLLKARHAAEADEPEFMRATAWLFGYLSHVVMDASIHPVVRAIVGEYDQNKTDHRVCEMYMDSYIYKETYDVELTNAEWADYLRSLNDGNGMDAAVSSLWDAMLKETYPDEHRDNPPDINGWHKSYVSTLDSADLNVGFFRHAAGKVGLLYVPTDQIPDADKTKYILNATLPQNNRFGMVAQHYDEIFSFAVANVAHFWKQLDSAISGAGDPELPELPNWNLDKGILISGGNGDATLWIATLLEK